MPDETWPLIPDVVDSGDFPEPSRILDSILTPVAVAESETEADHYDSIPSLQGSGPAVASDDLRAFLDSYLPRTFRAGTA